jgi:hypothetical protein
MARVVLLIAAFVEFILRGLPGFFGSEWIANLFGLEYIEEALVYVHPLGALMLVFGVMFFVASKDPVKYKFVIDMGILRYAATALSHIVTLVMVGSLVLFWWVHLVIDVILLVLFIAVRQKAAQPEVPAVAVE